MPPYASFVIRYWHIVGGVQRIKIEHIQSGDNAQMTSLEDALAWLMAKLSAGERDQVPAPGKVEQRGVERRCPADEVGEGEDR